MLFGDLVMTCCLARYTLRKRGRCCGDERRGGKCDDRRLHFSVLPGIRVRAVRLKLGPFREPAASRYGEGISCEWRPTPGITEQARSSVSIPCRCSAPDPKLYAARAPSDAKTRGEVRGAMRSRSARSLSPRSALPLARGGWRWVGVQPALPAPICL